MRQWQSLHNVASNMELGLEGNIIRLVYGIGFVEYVDFILDSNNGEFAVRTNPYRFPNPEGVYQTSGRFVHPGTLAFWEQREPKPYQGRRRFVALNPFPINFDIIYDSEWDFKYAATDYRAKDGVIVEAVPNALYINGVQLFHSNPPIPCTATGPTAGGYVSTSDATNGPLVITKVGGMTVVDTPRVTMLGRDTDREGYVLYGNGQSWLRHPDGTHVNVTVEDGEGIGCLLRVNNKLWIANHHSQYAILHPADVTDKFIKVDTLVTNVQAVSFGKWIILATEHAGILTLRTVDSTTLTPPVDNGNTAQILAKLAHMEQDIAEIRTLLLGD